MVRGSVVERRIEVSPASPFTLRGASGDGLLQRRGRALQRLLHFEGEPVLVGVLQPAADRVIFAARATTQAAVDDGIARMRFATGVDDDLRSFHERFRADPLIGRAIRAHAGLRAARRPRPWEALLAAVTEQLIDIERAIMIQRRLIGRLGSRCPSSGLRDAPTPAAVAAEAPARLVSLGLAESRALALRRVGRLVASGGIDVEGRHEETWAALRTIPGIGTWTVEYLALYGHGRYDQLPAGDLGYIKLVGRLTTGNPRARADEAEVRGFFDAFGSWRGLAGEYLMWAARRGMLPQTAQQPPARSAA